MTELLTSAQMQAIEQAAIAAGDVTGLELMERAGRGTTSAVFDEWPELSEGPKRAMILCGPGNNGGDGFVIARVLQGKGWEVDLFLFGDPSKLPPDAKTNHDLWLALGSVAPLDAEAMKACDRPDLFVDAVFGTGLTRALPEDLAEALDGELLRSWSSSFAIRRVAIDCPSGLNLDTGMIPLADAKSGGAWPKYVNSADLTATFHEKKLGHALALGPRLCGKICVVDIGLREGDGKERAMVGVAPDNERVRRVAPIVHERPVPKRIWPGSLVMKHQMSGHKYDHGHVMVMAGGVGRGGAARMAARTALRAGAGLVTVLCPPAALQENACRLDAVMLRACADTGAFNQIVDDRVSALCLGPGMGVGQKTRDLVLAALMHNRGERASRETAVVLDADALTSFEDDPESLFAACHARTVLTPHEGEFARLFPDLAQPERASISKVDAARQAADRAGCVVLLKGEDTVIVQPGGGASVHSATGDRAVPWLATAGAGDVLAGLIAGLAAPDTSADLFCVTEAAVWLHCESARQFGPGLIAEDLPDMLPKVFSTLAE